MKSISALRYLMEMTKRFLSFDANPLIVLHAGDEFAPHKPGDVEVE